MTPITVNFQRGIWNSGPRTQGPIPFFHTAAHQNLASKIFCLCCKCCEEPNATDDSKIPSQTQELQPSKHGLQKDELDGQNLKQDNEVSRVILGKSLLHPEKRTSYFSSSEFEATSRKEKCSPIDGHQRCTQARIHVAHTVFQNLTMTRDGGDRNSPPRARAKPSLSVMFPFLLSDVNSHVSKRGFHKRNPSRYSQDRWPYQPCLIGRP
ncbi:testis-expressed protein 48 [Balaenoptera musculus]|uniref:Testis-expressed protein 48 n=1 Tax=Balaenoptera musculus TaxID=9771 RepID=A0A8B8XKI1_BALMU|nr:testis-expressed protein 48 [Balaenoptera musculus]